MVKKIRIFLIVRFIRLHQQDLIIAYLCPLHEHGSYRLWSTHVQNVLLVFLDVHCRKSYCDLRSSLVMKTFLFFCLASKRFCLVLYEENLTETALDFRLPSSNIKGRNYNSFGGLGSKDCGCESE